jgi:SpoVK/Ycf46/Vps4 family AAA+-type ATPase
MTGINDPIQQNVKWRPLRPGGASFKTHKIQLSTHKLIVAKVGGFRLFQLAFLLPGALAIIVGIYRLLFLAHFGGGVMMLIFGAIFAGGGWLLTNDDRKTTFDKSAGVYYQGSAYQRSNLTSKAVQGHLMDVHALQLLDEQVTSTDSDNRASEYISYELNLVLKNGKRVSVMDHGDEKEIKRSAKQLSEFLSVPVWTKI